jgi:hypothetical protein
MGMVVRLLRVDGETVRGLPDPAGGTFDAAGDFDRVLPDGDPAFAVLKHVNPYGDTVLTTIQMDELLADISELMTRRLHPAERRGLERLRVMATRCRDDVRLRLSFAGD